MNTATSPVTTSESRLSSSDGRDAGGRFARGNRGGPGNPFAREVAAIRAVIYRIVTTEDVEKALRKLVELAHEGNFGAIKLLLSYMAGKPTAAIEMTFDDLEAEPTAPPSTNGSARPGPAPAAPSTNGDATVPSAARSEVAPSPNGPEPTPAAPAPTTTPSTNGPKPASPVATTKPPPSTNGGRPGGGKQHDKRLLTAGLRGKF